MITVKHKQQQDNIIPLNTELNYQRQLTKTIRNMRYNIAINRMAILILSILLVTMFIKVLTIKPVKVINVQEQVKQEHKTNYNVPNLPELPKLEVYKR